MQLVPLTISRLGAAVVHLTRGYKSLIDAADWPSVSRWMWQSRVCRKRNGRIYVYAVRTEYPDDAPRYSVCLHRFIAGATKPEEQVDHQNHDTLDNRRSNLRIGTHAENQQNRQKLKGSSSRYFGVTWHKKAGKWAAQIKHEQEHIHIGLYKTQRDAAIARDRKARQLHANARLNFPNLA